MNGSTAERSKGVCPTGWHIPSDCEWMYLEHGQGMSISDQGINSMSIERGAASNVGDKIKTNGSNTSGFSALFSGTRSHATGGFNDRNTNGAFLTSTDISSSQYIVHRVSTSNLGVNRYNDNKGRAMSVRCLKNL